jgi:hypothetical protein
LWRCPPDRGDGEDRPEELAREAALAQVGRSSGFESFGRVARRGGGRHDDDPGPRGDVPHALGRLEPIEDGHVEIHEHDVRLKQGGEVDRLLAVVRVAGDLQPAVGLKRDRQRFGEQRVVVGD